MHYSQRLKDRIAELEAETELLATQVQNKTEEVAVLDGVLAARQTQVFELYSEQYYTSEKIKSLTDELLTANAKLSDLQEENAALTEIHGRVLKERDSYRQKLSTTTHECECARDELVEAEKQLQGEHGWRKFYGGLLVAAVVVVVALGSYCVVLKNTNAKQLHEVVQ